MYLFIYLFLYHISIEQVYKYFRGLNGAMVVFM